MQINGLLRVYRYSIHFTDNTSSAMLEATTILTNQQQMITIHLYNNIYLIHFHIRWSNHLLQTKIFCLVQCKQTNHDQW